MILTFFTRIALDPVAVEHQHQIALSEAHVVGEHIAQLPACRLQIRPGQFLKIRPRENDVVAVHNDGLASGGADAHLLRCRAVGRGTVQRALHGTEFPLHDGLQLPVVQTHIACDELGCLLLLQAAFQMHIVFDLVPLHVEARPVGAEDGIGGVLRVRLRVIPGRGNNSLLIVAGGIAMQGNLKSALSLGVGGDHLRIVSQLRRGHGAFQDGKASRVLRGIEPAAHAADVRDGTSHRGGGECQGEIVPRLQQDGLRLHQPLPDGPVGGLPHIAALGVLQVCFSHQQGDFHIRDRRAGQHAPVLLFRHVGQNQALIGAIQHIRGADRVEHQSRARLPRLQQQMHLRIVAQRLKMPHTLHGVPDGFLVEDPPGTQLNIQRKPLRHQLPEDLQLHLTHDLHLNAAAFPEDVQLGVFLLQLPQPGQHRHGIAASGQLHPIGHDRLQQRRCTGRLRAQSLSREGGGKPRDRAEAARACLLRRSEFLPGVQPDLHDLFFQRIALLVCIIYNVAHLQPAPGDPQPGQPRPLGIPGDFIDPGGEGGQAGSLGRIGIQHLQKIFDTFQLQRRAEAAGEELPPGNQSPDIPRCHGARLQVAFQQCLVAQGGSLRNLGKIRSEIHAAG